MEYLDRYVQESSAPLTLNLPNKQFKSFPAAGWYAHQRAILAEMFVGQPRGLKSGNDREIARSVLYEEYLKNAFNYVLIERRKDVKGFQFIYTPKDLRPAGELLMVENTLGGPKPRLLVDIAMSRSRGLKEGFNCDLEVPVCQVQVADLGLGKHLEEVVAPAIHAGKYRALFGLTYQQMIDLTEDLEVQLLFGLDDSFAFLEDENLDSIDRVTKIEKLHELFTEPIDI